MTGITYRCRPVEIEAMQWVQPHSGMPLSVCAEAIVAWVNGNGGEAKYEPEGRVFPAHQSRWHGPRIAVRTLYGTAYAEPGEYMVMGTATFQVPPSADPWDGRSEIPCRDFYPVSDLSQVRHVKLTWEPTVAVAATDTEETP